MKLASISQKLHQIFRLPLAEDFDNVGLLCGNVEREITGILIAHDAIETIIDEAIEKNANLIVCFHPIIFSGLKSITGKNYVEKAILKAIENKIAIFAIHTALDNDFLGVNFAICEVLGLKNQQILMPKKQVLQKLEVYVPSNYSEVMKNALFKQGAGAIGNYNECSFSVSGMGTFKAIDGANPFLGKLNVRENTEETMISVVFPAYLKSKIISAMKSNHPYEEVAYQIIPLENENQYLGLGRFGELEKEMKTDDFLQFVKEKFNLKIIKHSPKIRNAKIKKVGVLGGSGSSGIIAARSQNCDAYITGDLKYHDYFLADNRMLICDIGHYESEQWVVNQIFEKISENFPKFAIFKTDKNTNPVNYF